MPDGSLPGESLPGEFLPGEGISDPTTTDSGGEVMPFPYGTQTPPVVLGEPSFFFRYIPGQKRQLSAGTVEAISILVDAQRPGFNMALDPFAYEYEIAVDKIGEAEPLIYYPLLPAVEGCFKVLIGPGKDIMLDTGDRFRCHVRLSKPTSESHETLISEVFFVQ